MEIRIGLKHTARELNFETEATVDEVRKQVQEAVEKDKALLTFTDARGREFLVDTESIAYLELGSDTGRRVGFVS